MFGEPEGFNLKFMTWNVRRSKIGKLAGDFDSVDNDDVGEFLAEYDVVALQEGWNYSHVVEIFEAANNRRKSLGHPEYKLYGPVNYQSSGWTSLLREPAGWLFGDEGSYGGLWLMTHLEPAGMGFEDFDACRGEDCFKAKGVQWARLYFNAPNDANSGPDCPIDDRVELFRPCPPPPSGDHYVDIFNIHTNNPTPDVCGNLDMLASLTDNILGMAVDPGLWSLYEGLKELVENNFNCGADPHEVLVAQLKQAGSFIAAVTREQKDRPAIIMGDFNLDGKTLDYNDNEYCNLLSHLNVGPTIAIPCVFAPTDDTIAPWPRDYDWDIDHGDIARERTDVNWYTGEGMGTFITSGTAEDYQVHEVPQFPWKYDGNERFDFILVRPPYPPNSPEYESASWVVGRVDDEEVWASPWPGGLGPPPERLSDHKPVVTTLKLVPLQVPPVYHKNWRHNVQFRVNTADATGKGECWGCGPPDLFTKLAGFRVVVPDDYQEYTKFHGNTCGNKTHVIWGVDGCMGNWKVADRHIPPDHILHGMFAELWDADDSSDNDRIPTLWTEGHPQMVMQWDTGLLMFADDQGIRLAADWPVSDNAPIVRCTRSEPYNMCLRFAADELPPGEQQ